MEPAFFASAAEFRAWLEVNHATAPEILVGFHRKAAGQPGMTWPESVDQALCFGWIDGVVRRIDETRYSRRFTPRRPRSIWSNVNIRRFGELAELGLAAPAGQRAFEARSDERSGIYGHERDEDAVLESGQDRRLRRNGAAWTFFSSQPAGYRRLAIHWVTSAKRPDTRERRLTQLIDDSAAGRRIGQLTWKPKDPTSSPPAG